MPNFEYIAINEEQKKLSGVISAKNIDEAKDKLREIKLSIVEIQIADTKSKSTSYNYKFQGTNSENKTIKGTIEANNKPEAIKTLIENYDLKVQYLSNIDDNQAEFLASQDLVQEISNKILSSSTQAEVQKFQASQTDSKQEITLISKTIQILKYVLSSLKEDLKKNHLVQLQDNLNILEKLKFSKNQEKTDQICQNILKLIIDQEIFKIQSQNKKSIQDLILQCSNSFYSQKNSLFSFLKLLSSTKSQNSRKILLIHIFKTLSQHFQQLYQKINFSHPLIQKINQSSFFFFTAYLSLYFLCVFLSNKVTLVGLPNIFYIYQSKILIFFMIAIFLWHIGISCNQMFFKNKPGLQKSNSMILIASFILLLTNF